MKKKTIFSLIIALLCACMIFPAAAASKPAAAALSGLPPTADELSTPQKYWEWFKNAGAVPGYYDDFQNTTDYLGFVYGTNVNQAAYQLDAFTTRIFMKEAAGSNAGPRLGYFKEGNLELDLTDLEMEFDLTDGSLPVGVCVVFGLMQTANPGLKYPAQGAGRGLQMRFYRSSAERLWVQTGDCQDNVLIGNGVIGTGDGDTQGHRSLVISADPSKNSPLTFKSKKDGDNYLFTFSITTDDSAALIGAGWADNANNTFTVTVPAATVNQRFDRQNPEYSDGGNYVLADDKAALMFTQFGALPCYFDLKIKDKDINAKTQEFYDKLNAYAEAAADGESGSALAAKRQLVADINVDTYIRPVLLPFCSADFADVDKFIAGRDDFADKAAALDPMTSVTKALYDTAAAAAIRTPSSPYFSEKAAQYFVENAVDEAPVYLVERARNYLLAKAFSDAVDVLDTTLTGATKQAAYDAGVAVDRVAAALLKEEDKTAIESIVSAADGKLLSILGDELKQLELETEIGVYEAAAAALGASPSVAKIKKALAARALVGTEDIVAGSGLETRFNAADAAVKAKATALVDTYLEGLAGALEGKTFDTYEKTFAAYTYIAAHPKPDFDILFAGDRTSRDARYETLIGPYYASPFAELVFVKGSESYADDVVDYGNITYEEGAGLHVKKLVSHGGSDGLKVVKDGNGKITGVTDEEGNPVEKDDPRYGTEYYHNRMSYMAGSDASNFETVLTIDRLDVLESGDSTRIAIMNFNFMVNPGDYRISDRRPDNRAGISVIVWFFAGEGMLLILDPTDSDRELARGSFSLPRTTEELKGFQLAIRLKKDTSKVPNRWMINVNEATILLSNSQAPLDMFDANGGLAYFSMESGISITPAASVKDGVVRQPILGDERSVDFTVKRIGGTEWADYAKPYYILMDELEDATCIALKLITKPAKLVYALGESLDYSGLIVKKVMSNDNYELNANYSEFTVTGFNKETPGKQTVTLTLKSNPGLSVSFEITVGGAEEPEGGGLQWWAWTAIGAGSLIVILVILLFINKFTGMMDGVVGKIGFLKFFTRRKD